jgi:L-alanine-DL-glutamate epimerase-like enolase superfamily enzyme
MSFEICFSLWKRFSIPPLIVDRTVSFKVALYETKLLVIGASKKMAAEAQKSLTALGYKNSKVLGVCNTAESDQEVITALKERQWDAISIGMFSSSDYSVF